MSQSSLLRSQSALGRGRSAHASVIYGRLLQSDAHLHPDPGERTCRLKKFPAPVMDFPDMLIPGFVDHADWTQGGRDAGCPAGLAEVRI